MTTLSPDFDRHEWYMQKTKQKRSFKSDYFGTFSASNEDSIMKYVFIVKSSKSENTLTHWQTNSNANITTHKNRN